MPLTAAGEEHEPDHFTPVANFPLHSSPHERERLSEEFSSCSQLRASVGGRGGGGGEQQKQKDRRQLWTEYEKKEL